MMKCYVPTLTTDLVTIFFLNIGEVITRELGVMDFVSFVLLIQRKQESKGRPGAKPVRVCYQSLPGPGQRRGAVTTARYTVFAQPYCNSHFCLGKTSVS